MCDAIIVKNLTKSYNGKHVLKKLDLTVKKGEIFALLGVNGAGKTTMLECMENLRKYDSGSVEMNGKMGIQLQSASLPAYMKAMEAVKLFAKWNKTEVNKELLFSLGINELAKKRYAKMSTGQKRRLHLALALINDPDIVFLDEPTAGLDVEGRISLHAEIRNLKGKGKTIVLASHDMAEVESLCDRIAILKDGEFVFMGTIDELGEQIGRHYMIVIKTALKEETFQTDDVSGFMLAKLEHFKRNHIEVLDIKIGRGSLEQHFMNIAKEKKA